MPVAPQLPFIAISKSFPAGTTPHKGKNKREKQDMKKFVRKSDLKGVKMNSFVASLLDDINAKGDINGRYFSSWWFDLHHDADDVSAMYEILWGLVRNYAKMNGVWYNDGTETQLKLSDVAEYIADKLNTWSGYIICWLRGMQYARYGVEVCDKCGLNTLYVSVRKKKSN